MSHDHAACLREQTDLATKPLCTWASDHVLGLPLTDEAESGVVLAELFSGDQAQQAYGMMRTPSSRNWCGLPSRARCGDHGLT